MTEINLYEQVKKALEDLEQLYAELQRLLNQEANVRMRILETMLRVLRNAEKPKEEEKFMSIKELANFLGVSESFMYANSRKMPCVVIGDRPIYIESEIIKYLKDHQSQPMGERKRGRKPKFKSMREKSEGGEER